MFITGRVFWTSSQRFACAVIFDVHDLHVLLQGIFVVLGIEAAVWCCCAHPPGTSISLVDEQLDEFVDRMTAVTDGVEFHAAMLTRSPAPPQPGRRNKPPAYRQR